MELIGNYLSPYVRRVAVSLNFLGMPFDLTKLMVFEEPETVRKHNPVVRIPTLVLDDGVALVESYAILDYIDQLAGPDKALVPPSGEDRRNVMQATAIAVGATEKAQWAAYEGRFHPPEKVHQPWIDHNDAQVTGGFQHLDAMAEAVGPEGWLGGTTQISQADITAAVGFLLYQDGSPAPRDRKSKSRHWRNSLDAVKRCPNSPAAPVPPVPG